MRISAFRHPVLVLAIACVSVAATAQKPSPTDRLLQARATYYTPTANGLSSFHCDVVIDWKDLLTRFSRTDISDDNPFLLYLNTARLSVTDDLFGKAVLEWSNTAIPPKEKEAAANQLQGGLQQMIGGFFQSWNVYLNGAMVPRPDKTVSMTETATGYSLHAAVGDGTFDEKFDRNMLLTEAHVISKDNDTIAYPKYLDSGHGLLISTIHSIYHAPPSAPAAEVTITMEYQPVSSFQLPSSMTADVQNVGVIRMKFAACNVKTKDAAPAKP